MSNLWIKLERNPLGEWPFYLADEDLCYFARDFISRGGYSAGLGNQLINNFKKPQSDRGKPAWRYKEAAIQQFAGELCQLLIPPNRYYICGMPSSKTSDHPEFDNRLDLTLALLKQHNPNIQIVKPFLNRTSREALHTGSQTRTPLIIYNNLIWNGLPDGVETLILIDDVLTTGCNFNACKQLLSENAPSVRLIGVFWAKTTWNSNCLR